MILIVLISSRKFEMNLYRKYEYEEIGHESHI